MHILVTDACVLITLSRGGILPGFAALPYDFACPLPVFGEAQTLEERERDLLLRSGMEQTDLTGEQIERALDLRRANKKISLNDFFAFVDAQDRPDSILLTSDSNLRAFANDEGIEVHGVLWVIDELHAHAILPPLALYRALEIFHDDPDEWQPKHLLHERLKRFRALSAKS